MGMGMGMAEAGRVAVGAVATKAVADMATDRGFGRPGERTMFRALPSRTALIVTSPLILAGLPAIAQPPPLPPAASTNVPSPESAADQRIRALQSQLSFTDAQMPQWNAFAQAMRDNATSTDALFRQRASSAASMSALDNMRSYAQVARAYADNTAALANAFEALYGVLSAQQKQTIDTLFRQQAAQSSTATQPNSR